MFGIIFLILLKQIRKTIANTGNNKTKDPGLPVNPNIKVPRYGATPPIIASAMLKLKPMQVKRMRDGKRSASIDGNKLN